MTDDYTILNLNPDACVGAMIGEIKKSNPQLKDGTIRTYSAQLRKLVVEYMKEKGDTSIEMDGGYEQSENSIPFFILKPASCIKFIEENKWSETQLSDRTIKNYYAVMLTLLRGKTIDEAIDTAVYKEAHRTYTDKFDELKKSLNALETLQAPKEKEIGLKDLTMKELKRYLLFHFNKIRPKEAEDWVSALYWCIGNLHLEFVFRNELATMDYVEEYPPMNEVYNKTNFIWNKGRNCKIIEIRDNKVRDCSKGDKPKQIVLRGEINRIVNKYLKVLENSGNPMVNGDKFIKKQKGEGEMTSSNYGTLLKKCWEHKKLNLTSTLIRKVYAIDIRQKYKGKLTAELEACEKLDHSLDVHNKSYVIHFD